MPRTIRLAVVLLLAVAANPPAAHARNPEKTSAAAQESICGRDLMTAEELTEHRAKMRSARTRAERDAYRTEHHAQMLKRAQERGVPLNPAGCSGLGMGPGRGPGWRRGGTPAATPPPSSSPPASDPARGTN